MSDEPREKTEQEVREELVDHLVTIAWYWDKSDCKTQRERLEGALFSFLAMLDGTSNGLCAFDLTPSFHPDDIQYHKDNGENWYPRRVINGDTMLHDMLHDRISKLRSKQ